MIFHRVMKNFKIYERKKLGLFYSVFKRVIDIIGGLFGFNGVPPPPIECGPLFATTWLGPKPILSFLHIFE